LADYVVHLEEVLLLFDYLWFVIRRSECVDSSYSDEMNNSVKLI